MVKPLTREETSINTRALMTSKNNPIVNTVSGNVNKMRSGFTIALANPSNRAAIKSDPPSAKRKPLKIWLATHRDKEVKAH